MFLVNKFDDWLPLHKNACQLPELDERWMMVRVYGKIWHDPIRWEPERKNLSSNRDTTISYSEAPPDQQKYLLAKSYLKHRKYWKSLLDYHNKAQVKTTSLTWGSYGVLRIAVITLPQRRQQTNGGGTAGVQRDQQRVVQGFQEVYRPLTRGKKETLRTHCIKSCQNSLLQPTQIP